MTGWFPRTMRAHTQAEAAFMLPDKHAPLADLSLLFSPPEGKQLLGAAANCVSVPILILAADRTILAVNEALAANTGYLAEELRRQPAAVLLPQSFVFRGRSDQRLNGVDTASASTPAATVAQRKDGSRFPVSVYLKWLSSGGETVGVAALVPAGERVEPEFANVLERAVRFERFLSDLTASFLDVPRQDADAVIERALHLVLDALDLDRCAVFQVDSEQDLLSTHVAARDGLPASQSLTVREFPWSVATILGGDVAAFTTRDDVPDPIERESLARDRTVAQIACPLRVRGRVTGAIAFAMTRPGQPWTPELLARIGHVTEVVGSALARLSAEDALLASERRFRTLADNAPVMIWMGGPDKRCTWFNRGWLEFVGHPLEHELGDGWVENVHPEDRADCLRIYETRFAAREPFTMEYRLLRHDGEWRWVLHTGAPNLAADGMFEGYLASCVDITDQKQAAERVEPSRDQRQPGTSHSRREARDVRRDPPDGRSAAIERVLKLIEQVAATDSTVLLLGETGTGKEFLATRIHELSARRARPMIRVNCAAIPATLIESELFGRERGAFTGALTRQVGRFESADHSTMFLDEIGDLPIDVQVKLLRVLEERQFERLGSSTPVQVDARIIAATHRNLEQRISEGAFREDLFYRLNVFPIAVPPLRERADDIPVLVRYFIDQFAAAAHRRFKPVAAADMAALQAYPWPGNIRELRNVVERAMILATGETLTIALPEPAGASGLASVRLEDIERQHIRRVLDATAWRIRGAGGAADRLGLAPTTLESRMTKLGLTRASVSS